MSKRETLPEVGGNPFPSAGASLNTVASASAGRDWMRAVQEVQAALVMAKRFPRDQHSAFNRIMESCKRRKLAEAAIYVYPRGGSRVTGPSIRLAEALAQNWGNLEFGIRELSQSSGDGERPGESEVEAFAWDMETNTRQSKVFKVPHVRMTRDGRQLLSDPRDIYEHVANNGARRLRACILGIIPGDVVDEALRQCEETVEKGGGEPLVDRVRKMVGAFAELGVTTAMLEARLGHRLNAVIAAEIVQLSGIYKAVRDGFGKREDYFEFNAAPAGIDLGPLADAGAALDQIDQARAVVPAPAPTSARKATSRPEPETSPNPAPAEAEPEPPPAPSSDSAPTPESGDGGDPGDAELPSDTLNPAKVAALRALAQQAGLDDYELARVLKPFGAASLETLLSRHYADAMRALSAKARKMK